MPQEEGITASDSENAQFVRVRDAVARVVREELHTAASKSDVLQVRCGNNFTWRKSSSARFFQVQRRFLLVHQDQGTYFAKIVSKLQVLRFAKLFPKLCLSDEGLTTVCLQLRKVRRKTFSLFVFFMLTVFPLLCLQLVTAHFKHGERTWSAENIEGEYHFGSIWSCSRKTLALSPNWPYQQHYNEYGNTQAMTVALLVFSLSSLNP